MQFKKTIKNNKKYFFINNKKVTENKFQSEQFGRDKSCFITTISKDSKTVSHFFQVNQ